MNFLKLYLNSFWRISRKTGRDAFLIVSKYIQAPSSARDILVKEAREGNNAVAVSMLKLDREIQLMRYHGFFAYLRSTREFNIQSAYRKASFGMSGKITKREESNVAKVPFMITSAQKKELIETLGYSTEDIKCMKPLEACIILEYKIAPREMESRLPTLIQEHHETPTTSKSLSDSVTPEQAISEISSDKLRDIISEKDNVTQIARDKGTHICTPQQEVSQSENMSAKIDDRKSEVSKIAPLIVSSNSTPSSKSVRLWYQVLEISPDNVESVGLFADESEAKICQDTKEHLTAKHSPEKNVKFEIRTTYR
jgi:hypothetical protein